MQIDDLKQDISSLQYEIDQLMKRKQDVMHQIESIDKRQPMLNSINALKTLIREETSTEGAASSRTKETKHVKTKNKRRRVDDEDGYLSPVPIQHEFFDPAISKYFKDFNRAKKTKKLKATGSSKDSSKEVPTKEDGIAEKLDNILLENIYRMFGITLFPILNPDRFRDNKVKDLLGVRMEIFNKFKGIFETPYYLILQKNSNDQWVTFKKTIPIYVDMNKYIGSKSGVSDAEVLPILKSLREALVKLSFKRQLFQHLESVTKLFKIKQYDHKFERISIEFEIESDKMVISDLKLNDDKITVCSIVESHLEKETLLRLNSLLTGDLNTFEEKINYIKKSF